MPTCRGAGALGVPGLAARDAAVRGLRRYAPDLTVERLPQVPALFTVTPARSPSGSAATGNAKGSPTSP
ncbi:hypothetical protein [Streptosporangium longisporum]|uniref:hypothetical protein n=1 Tax=Streptosporangium longisporum TaxID=46187 RepID=UPI0031E9B20D